MATRTVLLEALPFRCVSLCLAALDEPVFIRAQDILAPKVVVRWAHLAEGAGSPQDKVQGALVIAKQIGGLASEEPAPGEGTGLNTGSVGVRHRTSPVRVITWRSTPRVRPPAVLANVAARQGR